MTKKTDQPSAEDYHPRPWVAALLAPAVLLFPWFFLAQGLGVAGFPGTALGMLLFLVAGTATLTDLRWRRIYNWMTYPALGWTLLFQLVAACLPATVFLPRWGVDADGPPRPLAEALGTQGWEDMFGGLLVCFGVM